MLKELGDAKAPLKALPTIAIRQGEDDRPIGRHNGSSELAWLPVSSDYQHILAITQSRTGSRHF